MKTIESLKKGMQRQCAVAFLSVVLLDGCGTVVPSIIKSEEIANDSTTPLSENAWNAGFIRFVENERGETIGGIFTKGAVEHYNSLIEDYRLQFEEAMHRPIHINDGVTFFEEKDGKPLFFMDAQHCADFLKLHRWSKQPGVAKDSLWMKLKEKVSM